MNTFRSMFLLFLVLSLSSFLVPARAMDPEIRVAQAIQRIAERDFTGAVEKLEEALAYDPDNLEACYYAGVAHARLGDLRKAEALLERARILDPDAPSVLFELGLVRLWTGDCTAAADRFQTFRRMSPGDPRLEEIPGLLHECGGWDETFLGGIRWRFNGGLGGNYDTNVTLEPENPLGPKDRRPDWSGILFLSAGLVAPLYTDRFTLKLDYDFFQSFHVEESGFNVNFNRLTPSLSWRIGDLLTPSVGYVFENTLLATDTYGRVNSGFGKLGFTWGRGLFTDVFYTFRAQDYFNTTLFPTNRDRTGHCHSLLVRQYAAWKGIDFGLHGAGDFDRTTVRYWSYDGFRFGLEAAFRVRALQIGLSGAYAERRYQGDYPGEGRRRMDREQQYSAAVTYMITRWMSATLINTTVINQSNLDTLFDYNRNITGLFLAVGLP